ncbi:hypothetical protein ACFXJ8_19995 [Nonomuraea sp. NPDC059194]|uniref:hypothetical protein n=1 Tax=Nonomuraea sp. NPDC059194 TaxID=3346764 RepID=UPI0036CA7C00
MQLKWLALAAIVALCAAMPLLPTIGTHSISMIRDTPVVRNVNQPDLLVDNVFNLTEGVVVDERLLTTDHVQRFERAQVAPGVGVSELGFLYGRPTRPGTYTAMVTMCQADKCTAEPITVIVHERTSWWPSQLTFPGRVDEMIEGQIEIEGGPPGVLPTFTVIDPRQLPPGVSIGPDGHVGGVPKRAGAYDVPVRVCVANDCSGVAIRIIIA